MRILIIDDDEDLRHLLAHYLKQQWPGAEVEEYDPLARDMPGQSFPLGAYDGLRHRPRPRRARGGRRASGCPWHGWQWHVTTGANAMGMPRKLRRFETKVAPRGEDL